MRWLLPLLMTSWATVASAQQDDAEKLYRAMEKQLLEAKALKLAGEAEVSFTPFEGKKRACWARSATSR